MAAKKSDKPETLDDLLDALVDALPSPVTLDKIAKQWGLNPKTFFRLRRGMVDRPHHGTLKVMADGMTAAGLKNVDVARVRAAIDASRAAADK